MAKIFRALVLAAALVAPAALADPAIELVGLDGTIRTIGAGDLAGLAVETLTVPEPHSKAPTEYRAVPLGAVLGLAGVSFDGPLRGPLLVAQVRILAADGYRVAFSLPELDPRTGSTQAYLAFGQDGGALPADAGPFRLVVPTDKRAARWVRQVVKLEVLP